MTGVGEVYCVVNRRNMLCMQSTGLSTFLHGVEVFTLFVDRWLWRMKVTRICIFNTQNVFTSDKVSDSDCQLDLDAVI